MAVFAKKMDGYLRKKPSIESLGLKPTDRIAIHTASSGSCWWLVIGEQPFGKNGGRSKKMVSGRRVLVSIRGANGMLYYALDVLKHLAQMGDGEAFAYAIELKQKIHDVLYASPDVPTLVSQTERLFDALGPVHALEYRKSHALKA